MHVLEFSMTIVYIWSILATCNSLLIFKVIIKQTKQKLKFLLSTLFIFFSQNAKKVEDYYTAVTALLWSFVEIFVLCEFGERTSAQFSEILFWKFYALPFKVLKILPIILNDTQMPIILCSFGGILCTRKVFKNVSCMNSSPKVLLLVRLWYALF